MAKQIVILEKLDSDTYKYALWAAVPVARQSFYTKIGAVSEWKNASVAENTAIAAGQIVEKVETINVPAGSTLGQVQAFLQTRWTDYQALITANNPWVRYGSFWDGISWTAGGVA